MLADRPMGLERGSWSWGIRWNQRRCASPSLPLPFRSIASKLLPHLRLHLAMLPRSRHPPRTTGCFTGADFPLQPDGTLRCPAGQSLSAQEQRRARRWEPAHGVCGQHSQLPPLSVARAVPMAWRGNGKAVARVSVLLHPLLVGDQPLLWRDWSRREHRRACMQLVRHQRVEVRLPPSHHPPLLPGTQS